MIKFCYEKIINSKHHFCRARAWLLGLPRCRNEKKERGESVNSLKLSVTQYY
jgi:hypothetical protein